MPQDTSAVQQDFAHMQKMHMTDQPDAYGCVSLWWLGSVAVEISPTPVSMMSSSVCSRDPHHKHGISAHEVVFIKWAYLQETTATSNGAKVWASKQKSQKISFLRIHCCSTALFKKVSKECGVLKQI